MVDKLKGGEIEFHSTMSYFCFRLEDLGQRNLLLEFDSLKDRKLYLDSMLELPGRLSGNKIDNIQIPQGRPESFENNGKFYLHLIVEHELGDETNGYLYRGVLVEPRVLRLTNLARFQALKDQCIVRNDVLPPFDEIRDYVKEKRRDFLNCLMEEGIRGAQQMADYFKQQDKAKLECGFFEALNEFNALSEVDQKQLAQKLAADMNVSGTEETECLEESSAEPQEFKRTHSELEDMLNWRRGKD